MKHRWFYTLAAAGAAYALGALPAAAEAQQPLDGTQPATAPATAPVTAAPATAPATAPVSRRVRPVYPPSAFDEGRQGEAVLAVTVSPQGTVESVGIAKSSGHEVLDRAAVNSAKATKFRATGQRAVYTAPVRFEK